MLLSIFENRQTLNVNMLFCLLGVFSVLQWRKDNGVSCLYSSSFGKC